MTTKLRILTVGHSYVTAMNRAVARAVAADGELEVTVAAPNAFRGDLRPMRLDPEPAGSRLTLVGLDARWTRSIHCFRYDPAALNRLVRHGRFDVVHAWQEPFTYAGYQIARAAGPTPAAFCFRTAQNLRKWYPPPFGWFERRVLARADGWLAGGKLVYETMLRRGYPAARGRVLPLAVDVDAFRPCDPATRAAVRGELGLTPLVLGFAGRLRPDKGLAILMQVLERLPAASRWSFLALGSGSGEGRLRAWADRRGWADRVRVVLAKHEQMPRYLAALDLLLVPSQTTWRWREQFGRILLEGMACGVPVLASDSGEIPITVGAGGVILPEGDPDAWARAVAELLADEPARARWAERGLSRAREFAVTEVARQFRDYYRGLAEAKARGAQPGAPGTPARDD
jgi:glycosyltransferase involved in cell wall biosynthesis